MELLKAYDEYYGKGVKYSNISNGVIEKYSKVLPRFLLDKWKSEGLTYFNDGFFWLVNPDDYSEILSFFVPDVSNLVVVMRTAFGGLIFLNRNKNPNSRIKKNYNYFCPVYGRITWLSKKLEDTFNGWLTTKEIIEPIMFPNLYFLARKKLSAPAADEIFGFVPAIAFGGDLNPENIKILKTKEHLAFLSQIL